MKNISKKSGFTLVEILVFMVIYSALLVVITNIFVTTLDVKLQSQATSDIQDDGNYLLARMTYDIFRADSITTPTLGSTSPTLVIVIGGLNNTYQQNSTNLQITNSNGTNTLNSYNSSISNLSFQRLGNSGGKNSLRISFTLSSKIRESNGTKQSQSFLTTVGIR